MAAIDRGIDLPVATEFDAEFDRGKPRTALLPGLVWLFVGLAILGTRWFASPAHPPPLFVGWVPVGIGFAYLLYYFIEERKAAELRAD
jgi:hypothetical protein